MVTISTVGSRPATFTAIIDILQQEAPETTNYEQTISNLRCLCIEERALKSDRSLTAAEEIKDVQQHMIDLAVNVIVRNILYNAAVNAKTLTEALSVWQSAGNEKERKSLKQKYNPRITTAVAALQDIAELIDDCINR
jgi:hypothetical protein